MANGRAIGPDVLRGLAILMVTAAHMPYDHVPEAFQAGLARYGWLGVDIFFVLSGYLIGSELLRPVRAGHAPDLVAFYLKRTFRILPVFWLVLAVYAFLPGWREGATMAPAWRFFTFTVNLGLDIRTMRSFSHAWSLCVEEHFYLVLPILVVALRRVKAAVLPPLLVLALVVGGMVLRHSLWVLAQDGTPVDFLKLVYYPTWCRLDGLIAGVSLAGLRLFYPDLWTRWARPWLLVPAALCIGAAVAMTVTNGQILGEVASVIVYPLFSLGVMMVLAALVELEPRLQPLRWSGLGFMAAISYSLYLSQKLVFAADIRWLPAEWTQGWLGVLVFYVTSIAVAGLLWLTVEQPFLRLRTWLISRRAARTLPAA